MKLVSLMKIRTAHQLLARHGSHLPRLAGNSSRKSFRLLSLHSVTFEACIALESETLPLAIWFATCQPYQLGRKQVWKAWKVDCVITFDILLQPPARITIVLLCGCYFEVRAAMTVTSNVGAQEQIVLFCFLDIKIARASEFGEC